MAIVSLASNLGTDPRALERLLNERAQREQARLAQQQAEADAERFRLRAKLEQRRLDEQRVQADDTRVRGQRQRFAGALSQQDGLLRQADRLAAERIRGGELTEQHAVEERVWIEGQHAYRAQTTPPPASSLTDQLA